MLKEKHNQGEKESTAADSYTLNGLRRPIQICTLLLWPSDTLCILHDRSMPKTYISEEKGSEVNTCMPASTICNRGNITHPCSS